MGIISKIKNTIACAKAGWQTKDIDIKSVIEETYHQMSMLINYTRNKQTGKLPNKIILDYYLLGFTNAFTTMTLERKGISDKNTLYISSMNIVSKSLEITPNVLSKIISNFNHDEEKEFIRGIKEANGAMLVFESGSDKFLVPIMKYLDDNYKIIF